MKTTVMGSLIVVLGAMSLTAAADDFSWGEVTFQPRAYIGYADYSLESGTMTQIPDGGNPKQGPLLFGLPDRGKVNINGFIGGLGATVATGKFFGDIYYQAIPSETAYSAITQDRPLPVPTTVNYGDIDVKHYDWAVSLGYLLTEQWAVFGGYKAGETDSDQIFNLSLSPPDSRLLQTGNYSVSFDQGGPFLGTSYSFQIGPGALTLKVAYAYLSGEYKSDFSSTCLPPACATPVPALQQFSWDGDSNAYSFGASWTQAITDALGFSVGANYHYYKFDASGSQRYNTTVGGQTRDSGVLEGGDLTEDLFTLTAALFYRF